MQATTIIPEIESPLKCEEIEKSTKDSLESEKSENLEENENQSQSRDVEASNEQVCNKVSK